jgi:hypothetical protein
VTSHSTMRPRVTAAIAALALLWALFASPPGQATPERAGERAPHEIGQGSDCSGAVPSPPERRRLAIEGALAALEPIADVAPGAPAHHHLDSVAGGAAPALARWRLAHGTATSNP